MELVVPDLMDVPDVSEFSDVLVLPDAKLSSEELAAPLF
jgi:hypothetical protein